MKLPAFLTARKYSSWRIPIGCSFPVSFIIYNKYERKLLGMLFEKYTKKRIRLFLYQFCITCHNPAYEAIRNGYFTGRAKWG